MDRCCRVEDQGNRWLVVLGYNDRYYGDYYFDKEVYCKEEDVWRELRIWRLIDSKTEWIEDEAWEKIQQKRAQITAYEAAHADAPLVIDAIEQRWIP